MNDTETCDESPELVSSQFSDWYGFDTENDEQGKVTLTALVHESGDRWIYKKAGPFAEWCECQTGKPIVICHNLEYDLVNEFGVEDYSKFGLNYLKGRLISARYKNITFRDSFNHFRMSLKALGKAIGIEKGDMDIHNPEYVAQDSWICLKAMTQARDYIAGLGGKIGATSGSSAMSVWRFMTDDEFVTGPHDTPWMRKGYYGGRTEIFRPHTLSPVIRDAQGRLTYHENWGKIDRSKDRPWDGDEAELLRLEMQHKVWVNREQTIRGYDINSMYPFVMLNDFPEYLMEDPRFEKAKGMAEVTISVPSDLFISPLAYRAAGGELLYPVGVIRGVWTYDEIRFAEKLGSKVLKVHKAIGCNALVRPFDQFINTLYNKRKQTDNEADRLFLKVLMNSLYGKLASRNEVTRTVSRFNLLNKNPKRIDEVKWISYHRGLLDYKTPQQPYVNVVWGAMITAYSRILLAKYMLKVPPEKLIYCDTDSMYCINYELPESKEIGGMKLEKKASYMAVIQPKAYQLDDFSKAKGVPKAKMNDKGEIEVDFARQYIEEGFTEFQAPIRFRASINSKRGKANQWVQHSKGRRTTYSSKTLSGDRYLPPVIGEQLDMLDCLAGTTTGLKATRKQLEQRKTKTYGKK